MARGPRRDELGGWLWRPTPLAPTRSPSGPAAPIFIRAGPPIAASGKDIVRHPETWPASRLRRALTNAREDRAFALADECSEPAA